MVSGNTRRHLGIGACLGSRGGHWGGGHGYEDMGELSCRQGWAPDCKVWAKVSLETSLGL